VTLVIQNVVCDLGPPAISGASLVEVHMQGYGNHGTHFKFEGAQKTVRFGPTVGTASDSVHPVASQVSFSGHHLSEKVSLLPVQYLSCLQVLSNLAPDYDVCCMHVWVKVVLMCQ